MTSTSTHALPPPPGSQLDLRTLCRAIPDPILTLASTPPGWRRDVRIHPDRPSIDLRTVAPFQPAGVVDGAQRRVLLAVREGRPLLLEYVGAAAVDADGAKPTDAEERLYLAGSHLDAEFLRDLPGELPVVELDGLDAAVIAAEALEAISGFRQTLEVTVAARISATGPVVVDGSVRRLPDLAGPAIGVVKSMDTQHLTDESQLRALPVGWRSTPFTIPAQRRGETTVVSCYLRLHEVHGQPFTDGLVRLESTDPSLLDAAAAWAFRARQPPGSPDPRWACHLRPVARAEAFLKARMPALGR